MPSYQSILLVGPTGSGKTPLGDFLEEEGLWGRRAHHFDFGQKLRDIVEGRWRPQGLDQDGLLIVEKSLLTGALLEDDTFYVARSIFLAFADERAIHPARDIVVLNGLPRHVGQARDMAEFVNIFFLVFLSCSPGTVRRRIQADAGGDRKGRPDDSLEEIQRKLELFQARTIPLLDYYRKLGTAIAELRVGPRTSPRELRDEMVRAWNKNRNRAVNENTRGAAKLPGE